MEWLASIVGIRRVPPDEKASRSTHSGDCFTDRKLWLWKPQRYQRGREFDPDIDVGSYPINNQFAAWCDRQQCLFGDADRQRRNLALCLEHRFGNAP